jgi:predicted AAA+ superfamily ATPase
MKKLIPRKSYIKQIVPFMDKPVIKVVIGMRRSGKSSLLKLLAGYIRKKKTISSRNILIINKESLEFDFITDYKSLNQYVKDFFKGTRGHRYLFIDEIQEIEKWEKAAASFLQENIADIYLSGSNARMLSSEMATLLSGRYVEWYVYPLVFSEFIEFRKAVANPGSLHKEFELFLRYGGLPRLHEMELSADAPQQYIQSIFNTILLKDVVNRHAIREPAQLENIARFVFDNCGNITSARRIAEYLKSQRVSLAVDRVQSYISYMESAFLVRKVRRYDIKGLRHLEMYEKYYMGDVGLRHGFIGYRDRDIAGLLENVIYLDLLARGYQISIGKIGKTEVDFIAEKSREKIYIQVAYLITDAKTARREFGPLEQIPDNYPKYVLSMDNVAVEDKNGIKWMNILDFLINGVK